jgi:hypothetical protein
LYQWCIVRTNNNGGSKEGVNCFVSMRRRVVESRSSTGYNSLGRGQACDGHDRGRVAGERLMVLATFEVKYNVDVTNFKDKKIVLVHTFVERTKEMGSFMYKRCENLENKILIMRKLEV